jgi:anhydro-N-acetylmuramic acid kinase
MLFTGGGAFNKHLINRIEYHLNKKITLPEKSIINFKEALIFGFLGVLRYRNEINCLSSVTGASKNNCGGIINLP